MQPSSPCNLAFRESRQLPLRFWICRDSTVLVHFALVVDIVIYRALFQFSLNLFPTIFDVCGDDMTTLQHAARPRITGISIGSCKLAFRVIDVLVEYFSIGLDRDAALPAISGCDATFLTRANVVIGCVDPLVGMFVESCDEDRFFGSFLGRTFVVPQNGSKYEIVWLTESLQAPKHRR